MSVPNNEKRATDRVKTTQTSRFRLGRAWGWLGRWTRRTVKAGFVLALLGGLGLAAAVLAVPYPLERLDPDRGGALLLLDRRGELLRSVPGRGGAPGRWSWVTLDALPPQAVAALLVSEDRRFYQHRGVDPLGVVRALALNIASGRVAYGGSTITMQLVKQVHSPGRPRTLWNKVREAVWALRLERAMDKAQILEQYLNRVYYGNGAWGLEAAARLYFDRPAAALSVGQATLLAVIPRGPVYYDPLRHLPRTLERRDHILALLVRRGALSTEAARRARAEAVRPGKHPLPFFAPHFCDWALSRLPADVRRRGGVVHTTVDLGLQRRLERRVAEHVAGLSRRRLSQAGLTVLQSGSGAVRAMVGSAHYRGPEGQINITLRRRHPGSALKPFVYGLAIEGGGSPASIAMDILNLPGSAYRTTHLAQPERGPVRYREALAGSYNLAAIHTLERVGVPTLISRLRRAGVAVAEDDPGAYGLRLALGAAKVRLLDLAAAYGAFVRQGKVIAPRAVTRVELPGGAVWTPPARKERRVFSAQTAWQVLDMLADAEARRPVFGQELPVDLPYPVGVKTGTARGFADTVAVGVTREYTVAAWAGNFDGAPTRGLVAMQAAAPLVRAGLLHAGRGRALSLPGRPAGLKSVAVCPLSGMAPGPHCPRRKLEQVAAGSVPQTPCTWHRHEGGRTTVHYPAEATPWVERHRGLNRLASR